MRLNTNIDVITTVNANVNAVEPLYDSHIYMRQLSMKDFTELLHWSGYLLCQLKLPYKGHIQLRTEATARLYFICFTTND